VRTIAAGLDEPGFAQRGQVLGQRGLSQRELLAEQRGRAVLPLGQELDDVEAGRVGEGAQHAHSPGLNRRELEPDSRHGILSGIGESRLSDESDK
jgi:hypothetical protein